MAREVQAKYNSVSTAEEKMWKAQSDLRTLREACEIYKDKARLKAAKAEAEKTKEALEDIKFSYDDEEKE